MRSPILTNREAMNNIDQFYIADPAAFAGRYLEYLCKVLKEIDVKAIGRFVATLLDARSRGATVFFIGNGGSAATASHFANDLAIGTNDYEKPFRALSLTDNLAILTAVGNDFGYEEIFVRQLQVLVSRETWSWAYRLPATLLICSKPSSMPAPRGSKPWPSPLSTAAR